MVRGTQSPLGGKRGAYYRTKAFTINSGNNPLINAASPLLAIVNRLKHLTTAPSDLMPLYQDLLHEIKAFEQKCQHHGYPGHTIMAARYALCALLDETISNTSWGHYGNWHSHRLMSNFQEETIIGEKFFLLLRRSCEEPTVHIELLELMYLCLTLGFEGSYRQADNGHEQLNEILAELYDIIREQRGEFSKKLYVNTHQSKIISTAKRRKVSKLLTSFVIGLLLSLIYLSLNYQLHRASAPIYQLLKKLSHSTSTLGNDNEIP
ncbi:MAG: DotU family type IV/VI secretion system protein [Coxiellaceae bacterium]|nr:MAG: DotU family type IV/VI secretion system protein [Coxiellaceae bacterium]